MSLENFRQNNESIKILEISSPEFTKYGEVLDSLPFSDLIKEMANTPLPESGNIYIPSDKTLESLPIFEALKNNFYGQMPVQIGFCNGQNTKINALEYHKGEEINAAVTDLALFLGEIKNLQDNTISTDELECFFVPKGTVYTMYATTLHFSPCKVHKSGFRCAVVLPKGTNLALTNDITSIFKNDITLFAANKWLIGHRESKPVQNGAFCGLKGENYELKPLED